MTELSVLKKRIGGFRKHFNTKIKAANSLVKLIYGPPVLKTPIVVTQLQERLAECTQCVQKLRLSAESC